MKLKTLSQIFVIILLSIDNWYIILLVLNKYNMDNTFNKPNRSNSLPKIQSSATYSKLFHNKEELMETKKIFLERLDPK